MPLTQHVIYLVRFQLADGPHIAAAHEVKAVTPQQLDEVKRRIAWVMNQTSAEYPNGNPDFKILEVRESSHEEIQGEAQKLKAIPGRVGADEIGLDTPNRVLNEPQITQAIAANQTPG